MTTSNPQDLTYDTALAIVGMAGRFPGANDVDQFWQNLVSGTKSIRAFTDEELLAVGVDPALLKQPDFVKAGTVIDDVDRFDAAFFGYNPREAETMDPQHRLFLEAAWHALEDAAYSPQHYRGLIGVFAGSGFSSYLANNLIPNRELLELVGELQLAVGNERDSLASTVSYKLNLQGPSIAVQTFCSTSLVAVHLACQSLLTYECDMALAGGVAIGIPQAQGYRYQAGGIVSPDGECRTFDRDARGSVMGNGLGIVVLKRMEDALQDGDQIYAVIRGSAVNNDGVLKVGYTAPGLEGQSTVIVSALASAGVKPETVSYIEAHGTATPLGDAVELAAMIKAFRAATDRQAFCAIGSVKPNIGHLDRASGVTGLIKTALALTHAQLPPSLNFAQPSPELDLASSPFFVNTALRPWERNGTPRRAGVNSFGLGGTNAHVVLEEAPAQEPSGPGRPQQLLVLSARTETALEAATDNLVAYLKAHPEANLADVAYTLQVGRSAFNHRRMLVCSDVADAVAALERRDGASVHSAEQTYQDRAVGFVFPDLGEHDSGSGGELYRLDPAFRELVDACCDALAPARGHAVRTLILASADAASADLSAAPDGEQLGLAQAATFAVQYATARLLMDIGIRPQAMLGLGTGEYVAACLAGVLSLEDALEIVVARPQLPAARFAELLKTTRLNAPDLPLISGMTGTWIADEQAAGPTYWVAQAGATPRRAAGMQTLWQEPSRVLVELGTGTIAARIQHGGLASAGGQERVLLSALRAPGEQRSEASHLPGVLGSLWLAGVKVDWSAWYAGQRRLRLRLPTYPFERRRYWVEPKSAATIVPSQQPAGGKRPDAADWFYLPVWKRALTPAHPDRDRAVAERSPWLVFCDRDGIGGLLVEQLIAAGGEVVRVQPAAAFTRLDDAAYGVDPREPDDYRRLLAALGETPRAIVHLWSLPGGDAAALPAETFDRAQTLGFYSLVYLTRALGDANSEGELDIWAMTAHAQAVTGAEQLAPEQATVAGACRVIGQEYLNFRCRYLDLAPPEAGTWQAEKLAAQLVDELVSATADLAVAYRGNQRWVQSFEAQRLELATPGTTRLREGGVYLITGGLGGVGLILAAHLARTYRARLVLTGRSGLPPRAEWQSWLQSHDDSDRNSRLIRRVESLEADGAEVLVLSADVADTVQIRAVVERTLATFGALHGVIHAAGISDDSAFGVVQNVTDAACEAHFGPKAHGLYALEAALGTRDLDFCVLFSSLSAVLGGLGFVGYTAANSFMDAFVHEHNRTHPVPWLSVNWDTWHTRDGQHDVVGATVAEYEMQPHEGVQTFERVVACSGRAAQIVNSTGDLETRIDQWVRMLALRSATGRETDGPATLHPRPALPNPYVAPSNETEAKIAEIWQTILGLQEVGVHDNFLDLGGHSLMGTQLIARLRQTFRVNLPLTVLFDAPTIAELAVAVEIALIDELEKLAEDEALRLTSPG